MRDEPDPPRNHYQLKPREFERVNDHPGHAAPDSDPAVRPVRIDVHDHFQAANAATPAARTPPANATSNDVHGILRDNLARANAAGLNDVAPVRRHSRRKRDYWLTFAIGNVALIAGLFASPIFAGAGLVLFNVGLTWTMWFVMDDY